MKRRPAVVASCLLFWLLSSHLPSPAAIPSKAEILKIVDRQLQLQGAAVSPQQKAKIEESAGQYSSQDRSCPGYSFSGESGPVKTKNRLGAYFQAGFEAVFKGQFPAAAWSFLQGLKINSDCPVLLSNAAFALNRLGQHTDALTLLNYAVTLDTAFASALVNIASGAAALKQYETAKKALQMAIALSPEIKAYQDMLKKTYAVSGAKKKVETADLDAALDILNDGKSGAGKKAGGTAAKPRPSTESGSSGHSAEELVSGMGSSYESDMSVLAQFLPVLAQAGGQFLKESQWHAQKAKDAETSLNQNVHRVGAMGMELISQLFKGYIADLTGSWKEADDILQKQAKAIPDRPADYDPSKGLRPETKIPPLSIGFDGITFKLDPNSDEFEFTIGEGVILGFSHSSKGWAVKVGLGLQMQAGFMSGGGLAYYLKYDSQGAGSIKAEGQAEIMGLGAKVETTFSETTLFSFEDTDLSAPAKTR